MVDRKLQLKVGQTAALVDAPDSLELPIPLAPASEADALVVFVLDTVQLDRHLPLLQEAAGSGRLLWLAYPKAKQLNTDLNRDTIRDIVNQHGLDTVRQIAIDETWSALRLKPLA